MGRVRSDSVQRVRYPSAGWVEHTFPCGCWYFEDLDGMVRQVEVCKACLNRAFKYLQEKVYGGSLDMFEEEGYIDQEGQ